MLLEMVQRTHPRTSTIRSRYVDYACESYALLENDIRVQIYIPTPADPNRSRRTSCKHLHSIITNSMFATPPTNQSLAEQRLPRILRIRPLKSTWQCIPARTTISASSTLSATLPAKAASITCYILETSSTSMLKEHMAGAGQSDVLPSLMQNVGVSSITVKGTMSTELMQTRFQASQISPGSRCGTTMK